MSELPESSLVMILSKGMNLMKGLKELPSSTYSRLINPDCQILSCVKAANIFGYKTSALADSLFKTIPSVLGKENNDVRNKILSNFDINRGHIKPYTRVIGGGRPKLGKEFHSPANVREMLTLIFLQQRI